MTNGTIENFIQSKINKKNVEYERVSSGNVGGRDWINGIELVLDTSLKKGDVLFTSKIQF